MLRRTRIKLPTHTCSCTYMTGQVKQRGSLHQHHRHHFHICNAWETTKVSKGIMEPTKVNWPVWLDLTWDDDGEHFEKKALYYEFTTHKNFVMFQVIRIFLATRIYFMYWKCENWNATKLDRLASYPSMIIFFSSYSHYDQHDHHHNTAFAFTPLYIPFFNLHTYLVMLYYGSVFFPFIFFR